MKRLLKHIFERWLDKSAAIEQLKKEELDMVKKR